MKKIILFSLLFCNLFIKSVNLMHDYDQELNIKIVYRQFLGLIDDCGPEVYEYKSKIKTLKKNKKLEIVFSKPWYSPVNGKRGYDYNLCLLIINGKRITDENFLESKKTYKIVIDNENNITFQELPEPTGCACIIL